MGTGVVFSPTPISGTAVLEYGATEILPRVGAILKRPARLCRPGRQACRAQPRGKPGFSTLDSSSGRETDSPLEEDGFEPSVPLGREVLERSNISTRWVLFQGGLRAVSLSDCGDRAPTRLVVGRDGARCGAEGGCIRMARPTEEIGLNRGRRPCTDLVGGTESSKPVSSAGEQSQARRRRLSRFRAGELFSRPKPVLTTASAAGQRQKARCTTERGSPAPAPHWA